MSGNAFIVVPLNLPGVSRGKPTNKTGQRALNQGEIFFEDVRVPSYYMVILGGVPALTPSLRYDERIDGHDVRRRRTRRSKRRLRIVSSGFRAACGCAAPARAANAVRHVHKGGGGQGAVTQGAAPAADGLPTHHYSMAAKIFCTQTAEVASDAVQLHGGMGLVRGVLVEQLVRDARAALMRTAPTTCSPSSAHAGCSSSLWWPRRELARERRTPRPRQGNRLSHAARLTSTCTRRTSGASPAKALGRSSRRSPRRRRRTFARGRSEERRGVAAYYEERDIFGVLLAENWESTSGIPPISNDFIAGIVRNYPQRFIGFCSVDPWQGRKAVDRSGGARRSLAFAV